MIAPAAALTGPVEVLQDFVDALPCDRPIVLVAHSNAGLHVPALVAARDITGAIFVDAGLPTPSGRQALAPPELLEFLRGLVDQDGLLPGWTHWWDDADVDALFTSASSRREVEAEMRRLPLGYFEQSLPIPAGWDAGPGAYLAFGDTYAADRDAARARGWPVRALSGEHLHMLGAPNEVADVIAELLGLLGAATDRIDPTSGRMR